jgi:prepilin-type N-terminal cleavage/methylation domain-containing protein
MIKHFFHTTDKQDTQKGFTLIELLLVVVIIGILLAVIVPRAWRANIDAKYGIVRQNCSELASFSSLWAEEMLQAQEDHSTSRLVSYFISLTQTDDLAPTSFTGAGGQWIGNADNSNWNKSANGRIDIAGRTIGSDTNLDPEAAVEDFVPIDRLPRNPFSGVNVFYDNPGDNGVTPGAIAAGSDNDTGNWAYFGLIFQGTDSTDTDVTNTDSFHAGMGTELRNLRNGVFMARLMQE